MQTWPPTWLAGVFAGALPAAALRPLRAAEPAFEAALKRRLPGDDANDGAAVNPPPAPPPLQRAAEAAPWTAQPVAEPQAALRHWQLQAEPAVEPAARRWQFQLLDNTLPVQQLDVQRTPAGTLQVVVGSASADGLRPLHTERLRQRLAARGETPVALLEPPNDTQPAPPPSSCEQELP
jgi:hypothetical protein